MADGYRARCGVESSCDVAAGPHCAADAGAPSLLSARSATGGETYRVDDLLDDEDDSHLYGIDEGYDPLLVETSDETADADDAYHAQGMREADRRWGRRTEWT